MDGEKNFALSDLPGELRKRWPLTADGKPEPPRYLASLSCVDMADTVTAAMLEAYGIPVLHLHPGDGDFGKLILGISGTGTDLYVPDNLYNDAKMLMEAEPDDDLQG